ncbi:MAG TPA: ABC transporter ATP-binding protein [Bryobacterales bacterium]|nr:ABC transporter ATP-binding protein [Bryobacterales bacterium]
MTVIELQNVGKRFFLHHKRQLLAERVASQIRRDRTSFWALRNVSLRVEAGETVGIIGANGAGKSTLLSIAVGVSTPSEGVVIQRGRVSALLELGSGFHPDLTGRENIHLNAALLGYTRALVQSRLDSIIDFAGIPDFIDEPLRTYSSGMMARLGFSVAIHLDPDILVLDEVLAVGDQEFQKRCMDRIHEFQQQGKTLLFVSHSATAVEQLCQRAVWLELGRVRRDGPAPEVLAEYRDFSTGVSAVPV